MRSTYQKRKTAAKQIARARVCSQFVSFRIVSQYYHYRITQLHFNQNTEPEHTHTYQHIIGDCPSIGWRCMRINDKNIFRNNCNASEHWIDAQLRSANTTFTDFKCRSTD